MAVEDVKGRTHYDEEPVASSGGEPGADRQGVTHRKPTNLIVMQSGGCTAVMNRSLFGVADEARRLRAFRHVFGAPNGLEGLLAGGLVDLWSQSEASLKRIARTPGAALGSTRRKLRTEDIAVLLEVLAKHAVGCFVIIGGNDSAETGHTIYVESRAAGHDLSVINVPKTIDNDLVLTDHTPGYGSAARFVALATMGAGRDAEAMGKAAPITVIEVMGRDAGWLPAAAALAKRDRRDAPHVICAPESLVDEDRFLARVEEAYRSHGFAVAVVGENVRGTDGPLGGHEEPWYVDDFGHPYYDGPGRYLASAIARRLNVRARYEKPGTIQRSLVSCVSRVDALEAEMVGRAAAAYAAEGHTDRIVTLTREDGARHTCTAGLAPLEEVAGRVRQMPPEFLDSEAGFVTPAFIDYARLLVGPLPRFGRLA